MQTSDKDMRFFLFLLIFGCIISLGFLGYLNYQLKQQKISLEGELVQIKSELASTTEKLNNSIKLLEGDLSIAQRDRDSFEQSYLNEKNKMFFLEEQIRGISGVVGALDKLSKMDPELLKKYSKVYFLNEHYSPPKLIEIDSRYVYQSKKDSWIHIEVWPFLFSLIGNAVADDVDIQILSAFRSFDTQARLKSAYLVTYGAGTANTFSADQGYSEHQLGTAIDFTTSIEGEMLETFGDSKAYQWLVKNAHKYGFVLSYPEENAYYKFEPWHWRFVGKELAQRLYDENEYFYNLDQRAIDEYLIWLFD